MSDRILCSFNEEKEKYIVGVGFSTCYIKEMEDKDMKSINSPPILNNL